MPLEQVQIDNFQEYLLGDLLADVVEVAGVRAAGYLFVQFLKKEYQSIKIDKKHDILKACQESLDTIKVINETREEGQTVDRQLPELKKAIDHNIDIFIEKLKARNISGKRSHTHKLYVDEIGEALSHNSFRQIIQCYVNAEEMFKKTAWVEDVTQDEARAAIDTIINGYMEMLQDMPTPLGGSQSDVGLLQGHVNEVWQQQARQQRRQNQNNQCCVII